VLALGLRNDPQLDLSSCKVHLLFLTAHSSIVDRQLFSEMISVYADIVPLKYQIQQNVDADILLSALLTRSLDFREH